MTMRWLLGILLSIAVLAASPAARAGSYLDRAALVLDESRKEGDLLQPRVQDRELVAMVLVMATARALAGRKMEVPAAVGKAHPHLLLVLEHYERAADAANQGDYRKFMEHLTAAREEERTFHELLTELGFVLPDLKSRR